MSVWDLGMDDSTAIWCFQINGPELRIVGVVCWVPTVGGGGGGRRSLTHRSKLSWHVTAHPVWTILGVKLPAKLVAIEENRIIAAVLSFICSL